MIGKARGTALMLAEACGHVAAHYRDLSAAQRGDTTEYAVGVYLRGVTRSDYERVRDELGPASDQGDWTCTVAPRRCMFVVFVVEADTPERAGARAMDVLNDKLRAANVTPDAIRVEVDGTDPAYAYLKGVGLEPRP